jgi:hypothetical protein
VSWACGDGGFERWGAGTERGLTLRREGAKARRVGGDGAGEGEGRERRGLEGEGRVNFFVTGGGGWAQGWG